MTLAFSPRTPPILQMAYSSLCLRERVSNPPEFSLKRARMQECKSESQDVFANVQ